MAKHARPPCSRDAAHTRFHYLRAPFLGAGEGRTDAARTSVGATPGPSPAGGSAPYNARYHRTEMKCASASSSGATASTSRVTSAARAANSRRVSSSTIPPKATIVSSMSARSLAAGGKATHDRVDDAAVPAIALANVERLERRFVLRRLQQAAHQPGVARAIVTQRRLASKMVWYGVIVPPSRGVATNRSRNSPSTSIVSACFPSK